MRSMEGGSEHTATEEASAATMMVKRMMAVFAVLRCGVC